MLAVLAGSSGHAQDAPENCTHDAMLVFDSSGSMAEMGFNGLDTPRIFSAREALQRALPDITPVRRVGLMVYGPGPAEVCANVDLLLRPAPDAAVKIIHAVSQLTPGGQTPLTVSVKRAAEVLGAPDKPGTVVLVTDGKETCGGTPCRLAANLAADAPGLVVHVIGFQVRGDFFAWRSSAEAESYTDSNTVARCLADRTSGLYVSTETVDELTAALRQTLGCAAIG